VSLTLNRYTAPAAAGMACNEDARTDSVRPAASGWMGDGGRIKVAAFPLRWASCYRY
jgi:hypothetical protein